MIDPRWWWRSFDTYQRYSLCKFGIHSRTRGKSGQAFAFCFLEGKKQLTSECDLSIIFMVKEGMTWYSQIREVAWAPQMVQIWLLWNESFLQIIQQAFGYTSNLHDESLLKLTISQTELAKKNVSTVLFQSDMWDNTLMSRWKWVCAQQPFTPLFWVLEARTTKFQGSGRHSQDQIICLEIRL